MTRPWVTLATVDTPEGPLELRQRGQAADGDFLIAIGGRVLMNSQARRSEEALATLGLATLAGRPTPRVLVGGLGMGLTLRAALDVLPADAKVIVAELQQEIVDWCRGPLAPLTGSAITDPRVNVIVTDAAKLIAAAPADKLDAILLDLYEGPSTSTQRRDDPFYGAAALGRALEALKPGGVLAIWGEDADPEFPARFEMVGYDVKTHRPAGDGGRTHVVYVGTAR